MTTSTSERRTELRKPLRAQVAISLPGTGPVITGRALDITSDGLGLVVEASLPKGSPCRLQFKLHFRDGTGTGITADGTIAFCVLCQEHDGFKTGVRFGELPPAASAALQRYLRA